jgi:hypothetical protein
MSAALLVLGRDVVLALDGARGNDAQAATGVRALLELGGDLRSRLGGVDGEGSEGVHDVGVVAVRGGLQC